MFNKILIANRGEIACRIATTARRMAIQTVAIYSTADINARHVALCDEAYWIGEAPARESYLCGEKILAIAKRSGAQAIHPGYGFLSENAQFARDCEREGVIFIGPPANAIEAMGEKNTAKHMMQAAGVPIVPGYHGKDQSLETLSRAAEKIGFPLLIKASAGGGGKGMRIVHHASELTDAIIAAKGEALSSFGNDEILLEKYIEQARHIEIQIFADSHDNIVHLFERDCSMQRRHQKILEESPAANITQPRRRQMVTAAVAAARAVQYVGAGTVEFIMDNTGQFYFMEMNTRLQVEHGVTEMITGLDLVEWQFHIASGESLPLSQEQITCNGHAIELRIYAEDPAREFLPANGTIDYIQMPMDSEHIRVDSGVVKGEQIGVYYDPLIAKLIAWDKDRAGALRHLHNALKQFHIGGVTTNIKFLRNLIIHPNFVDASSGQLSTAFIDRHRNDLLTVDNAIPHNALALAALIRLHDLQVNAAQRAQHSQEPYSPWSQRAAWRLYHSDVVNVTLYTKEALYNMPIQIEAGQSYIVNVPSGKVCARAEVKNNRISATLDDMKVQADFASNGQGLTLFYESAVFTFSFHKPHSSSSAQVTGGGTVYAPMPGIVAELNVAQHERVSHNQTLLVLEAMKMRYAVVAPCAGVVRNINCRVGVQVSEGAQLITIEGGKDRNAAA